MKSYTSYLQKKLRSHKPKLEVDSNVIRFIIETTKGSPSFETGGILMGVDSEPLTVKITHASLPGPKAFHSKTKFLRDTEYCKKVLQEKYEKYGVDYVGEWHSHVLPIRGMSGGDFNTIVSIMSDPCYDFNAFACIVSVLYNNEVELKGYISHRDYVYPVKIDIVVNLEPDTGFRQE
ncbi:MAG: hypothetical protein ACOY9Y_01160 [Bacillota bacterium]